MKNRRFITCCVIFFIIEIIVVLIFFIRDNNNFQDAVAVNEVVQSVQRDWKTMEEHKNQTGLDYVVLDKHGKVIFKTKDGLS